MIPNDAQPEYPLSAAVALASCFGFASIFVGSLYVWKPQQPNRDLPANIKRRFLSVTVSIAICLPVASYLLLTIPSPFTVAQRLGFRTGGLVAALLLPLLHTVVLFGGPLTAQYLNGELAILATASYWRGSLTDACWIRNHVVAPLTEEFTFRACMMPLLLAAFRPDAAVRLSPLFFGVAHLHHAVERYRSGTPLARIAVISAVQFAYTSIFGAYSAYLFARTGHYVAPVVAHAFCNHMGVPQFTDIWQPKCRLRRMCIGGAYVAGLVGWMALLRPLTEPQWYQNAMYWQQ